MEWSSDWIYSLKVYNLKNVIFNFTGDFVVEDKYSQLQDSIWKKEKEKDPNIYNGTLLFIDSIQKSETEIKLDYKNIRFSQTLLLYRQSDHFGPILAGHKGILGVVCIITTKDSKYFLGGRRSKNEEWHHKRWQFPGGLVEIDTIEDGLYSAAMSEINEEILYDFSLDDGKLIGVSSGRQMIYFNFFLHFTVSGDIDVSDVYDANYEFIDNKVEWKSLDEICSLDDKQIFGGVKLVKYHWKDYLKQIQEN